MYSPESADFLLNPCTQQQRGESWLRQLQGLIVWRKFQQLQGLVVWRKLHEGIF